MKPKKTKKKTKLLPAGRWKEYVRYLLETQKIIPLKKILKIIKRLTIKFFVKHIAFITDFFSHAKRKNDACC